MNMIDGTIEGNEARLGDGVHLPLIGHLAKLGSGRYRFGVRANHLSLVPSGANDVEIAAVAELAEVSGSKTFIHVTHNEVVWVEDLGNYRIATVRLGKYLLKVKVPEQQNIPADRGYLSFMPKFTKLYADNFLVG